MYEYLTSTVVLLVVSKIYINLQFKLLILHVSKFICHGQRLKTYEHRRRGAAASPTAATIRLFVHSGSITRHVVSPSLQVDKLWFRKTIAGSSSAAPCRRYLAKGWEPKTPGRRRASTGGRDLTLARSTGFPHQPETQIKSSVWL